jgi:hypothetical protein
MTTRGATFEAGVTYHVLDLEVGPHGARGVVKSSGPADGTIVAVAACAVGRPCILRVGYDDGQLNLVSGVASGKVLRLWLDGPFRPRVPVLLGVPDEPPAAASAVVAYSIDDTGRLHALDPPRVDLGARITWLRCEAPARVTLVYAFPR